MITQEQFNTVVLGLAAQGWKKSKTLEGARCLYRSQNGLKCAIGQMIPDDQYRRVMDRRGRSWTSREFHNEGMLKNIAPNEFDALQSAHDRARSAFDMEQRFQRLAADLELEWPIND